MPTFEANKLKRLTGRKYWVSGQLITHSHLAGVHRKRAETIFADFLTAGGNTLPDSTECSQKVRAGISLRMKTAQPLEPSFSPVIR